MGETVCAELPEGEGGEVDDVYERFKEIRQSSGGERKGRKSEGWK